MSIQSSTPDSFNDFHPIATETIMLSHTSTQWAQHVCRDIADADEQWHGFLRALAMAGFEQWLNQGGSQLSISYPKNTAPVMDATIQVGDFQLCILPMGVLEDDWVSIPATAVVGENAAHLYVLVEVHEEIEQVRILAGLRHDRLKQDFQPHGTEAYVVPVSEFMISPERLLWYLNCLSPEAILQGASDDKRTAATVLKEVAHGVINTGRWLQGQLDAVADELAWQLIPSLEPSYGLRGLRDGTRSQEKMPDILQTLQHQGVEVPANAAGACKAVRIGNMACELYTLVWELSETREWSLFVFLGLGTDEPLPVGLGLRISDENQALFEGVVKEDAATTYLYGQGIGDLDEQLIVEINSSDGETVTLQEFGFEPEG